MNAPHPLEASNRTAKARRFVLFLDEHAGAHVSAATLEQLTTAQWLHLTNKMNEATGRDENVPSATTIAAIVAYVRAREDMAATHLADPFSGLA